MIMQLTFSYTCFLLHPVMSELTSLMMIIQLSVSLTPLSSLLLHPVMSELTSDDDHTTPSFSYNCLLLHPVMSELISLIMIIQLSVSLTPLSSLLLHLVMSELTSDDDHTTPSFSYNCLLLHPVMSELISLIMIIQLSVSLPPLSCCTLSCQS